MASNETSITWTATNGKAITVEAHGDQRYRVTVDGVETASDAYLNINPRAIPDAAYKAGMRGILLGTPYVAVSAERVAALQALDTRITAEKQAAREADPRTRLSRLEGALGDARHALTTHGYGATGARGEAVERAEAALAAWKREHADIWAQVKAERQAERSRRAEELRPGVERALRGED